jgi:hypothetical protein
MSRQRRKQRRNAARRPWWRPLVGLGLLAGWLAVSDRLDVDRSEEKGDTASEVDRWEDEGGHDRAG